MNLLIIDDNRSVRLALKMVLAGDFDRITTMDDPRLIPAVLAQGEIDAVLLDMNFDSSRLDGSDGLFWLRRIRELAPTPAVVLITAFGNVGLAVEAMKHGADDFVTKPWDNDRLRDTLRRAVESRRVKCHESLSVTAAREIERREELKHEMTLEEVKAAHVRETLQRCGGNIAAAAGRLGVNRQTIYNILKKQGDS